MRDERQDTKAQAVTRMLAEGQASAPLASRGHYPITKLDGHVLIMGPTGGGHSSIVELCPHGGVDLAAIAELICLYLDGKRGHA